MSILIVIAILVALIVVHEMGHFFAAKWLGVKVEEFGVGYPPRAMTLWKSKNTEYTLNWLPFGGFVRLFGEELNPSEEHKKAAGSFAHASKRSQAIILVAGVFANAVFAWVLFAGGLMAGMPTVVPEDTEGARLVVSAVVLRSPAEAAGIMVGDEIVRVTDTRGRAVKNTPSAIAEFTSEQGGRDLRVTYLRGGEESTVTVVPVHAVIEDAAGRPALGVALSPVADIQYGFFESLIGAVERTYVSFGMVGVGLYTIVEDAISGDPDLSDVVGPVGLVGIVGDSTGYGLGYLLSLAAFISVNLAIINLIPIPALDGGRLAVVGIEALRRKAVPHIAVQVLNFAGFGLIILLMIVVTYNDILRLL